jgi:hypothetical protein
MAQLGGGTPGISRRAKRHPDISFAVIHKLTSPRFAGPLRSLMNNCETDIRVLEVMETQNVCPFSEDEDEQCWRRRKRDSETAKADTAIKNLLSRSDTKTRRFFACTTIGAGDAHERKRE